MSRTYQLCPDGPCVDLKSIIMVNPKWSIVMDTTYIYLYFSNGQTFIELDLEKVGGPLFVDYMGKGKAEPGKTLDVLHMDAVTEFMNEIVNGLLEAWKEYTENG